MKGLLYTERDALRNIAIMASKGHIQNSGAGYEHLGAIQRRTRHANMVACSKVGLSSGSSR